MQATIKYNHKSYLINLEEPIDISIRLKDGSDNLTAWYCPPPRIEAVMTEYFTGDVNLGGPVNFRDVYFNPHGHGTHTECVGHISTERYNVNECIREYNMPAYLLSIEPELQENGDDIIMPAQIAKFIFAVKELKVLIIRTLPNHLSKISKQYSNSNPPYMHPDAMRLIVQAGIEHLMIDTPSVDKEEDGGALECHHIFWNYPQYPRTACSITELIYVPELVKDGFYWLQLGIANFENDAAPSRPLLYKIIYIND